ncbi:tetratricopeptide repeat protein [Wenzhouxiangella marina]|uniref:Putative membrane protein n=1 Tax=Wenzhouxiangella marina TaxID=1579979 RepID=A0A0K0XZA8_9GAMM|nr:tetratricopeptide repeat protein [Wenzhouxiangella marina]AKS42967.1 Putative membrane protein [Wenzhouxiangella marina]MBB6087349.1 tetratricopeptide (TPR) repeat protein [Wenzhouxiangella marina]
METNARPRRRVRRAVGPRLRVLLVFVLALFALLLVNSLYLGGVTWLEWYSGETYQDFNYQAMFLFHLAAGLLLLLPALVFMGLHMRNTWSRPNRRAVYVGFALFGVTLALLISGLLLVRFDFFQIRDPLIRDVAYWLHVLTPLICIWLFVLHRLVGPRIRWKSGLAVAGLGAVFVLGMIVLQAQDPRQWNRPGQYGEADFRPALTRSATGNYIPAETMMMDDYCASCHADVHAQWSDSVHRFASFNNPVYLMSVRNTRDFAMARDGNVDAARFCAGCHDLVPLLSGAFDDPNFDDVNHPTAHAGITCTSCHAITHVNSPRGNGDFTIEEPIHYPFTFSENGFLQWVNAQLILAKPAFHQRTFLKPLHESPEFCGSCHKVHLPEHLNGYKWLRGQNHYDSFLLSGVSGHGVTSFYYPPEAEPNCNGCHMPHVPSDDFGARVRDDSGVYTVSNHLFPAANTAIPTLVGRDPAVVEAHQEFLRGSVRLDLVALRADGRIDGELIAPLRPQLPVLQPGRDYLLETVIRTLRLGHPFTQGTADSNQVWVELEVEHEGEVIARSGAMDPDTHEVDPWSHFVNVWMLDRDGNRIERRNPEDIFVPLYNHQIPPGAADVVHYRLAVPEGLSGELTVTARLHYRKFDNILMRHVEGESFQRNELPITVIAEDRLHFPIGEAGGWVQAEATDIPEWQRFNDYGIGLLRKPERRQLRQAEEAFARVEALGSSHGPLNLARVYLEEGRLDEAADALQRASAHAEPPVPWSMAWWSGRLLFEQGRFDAAYSVFEALAETRFAEARERGFDFSRDYRLLNQLGLTALEQARASAGEAADEARQSARRWFEAALVQDPENAVAHYNLGRLLDELGDASRAQFHSAEYQRYRVDDNARDRAINLARQSNPAADHAADAVVIYDPQRPARDRFSASAALIAERVQPRSTTPAETAP